ncbi:hypothetical protein D8S82_14520 [Mycobacterium hodleri]|uniref:Uncharacterized protein n=1 Tax=Mycolicibacterium hodleri TaxID=49897 RepID=A0A544W0K3_9MYCO|nr:hypothetical protein [Mycolicibacterium hodleri]TQR85776.1 hypothetical protein D8S82_14520 [Mycolicibacterium hodleri]
MKWLLGAVAVLLVIAIAVGIAVIVMSRGGDSRPSASPTGVPSDIASANDTGPVSIITNEPTCATFVGINNSLADLQTQGWGAQRKALGPASEWTPEQRSRVEAVATGMRNAANQSVALAKQTPHRVVRELYEQFIANGRAYADSVRDYVPADDGLASANVNASSAIIGICNTITFGSSNRGLGVDPAASPTTIAAPQDPQKSLPFITEPTSTCSEWVSRLDNFNSETTAWADADPSVPASEWTPERRTLEVATRPLLTAYANDAQAAGRESGNPAFEDFALSSALYLRTYLTVADNYTGIDGWLSYTGFKFANLVSGACRAAAG